MFSDILIGEQFYHSHKKSIIEGILCVYRFTFIYKLFSWTRFSICFLFLLILLLKRILFYSLLQMEQMLLLSISTKMNHRADFIKKP